LAIASDKLGLLGFAAVMVLATVSHMMGSDSGSTPRAGVIDPGRIDPGRIDQRRPATIEGRERRPPPRTPATNPGDPGFVVELGAKHDSTGTAFSIGDGVWMTARHVVDGCRQVGIVTGSRKAEIAHDVQVHPGADLAIFRTRRSTASLGFETVLPESGQAAYHFGFPQGKPGDVRSTMIGHTTMRLRGRYRTEEPVIAWAERTRVPNISTPLSGISGGPVVDADGQVIGVHVAGSKRRGRSFTTAPSSMRQILDQAGVTPLNESSQSIGRTVSDDDFAKIGGKLRQQLTVAKAICRVR
jgi:serine protease Do